MNDNQCTGNRRTRLPRALLVTLLLIALVAPALGGVPGEIVRWGYDLGETPTGTDYTAIDAYSYTMVALRADGSIVSWGDDGYYWDPQPPTDTGYTAVSAGLKGGTALNADGSIVVWGDLCYGTENPPEESNFVAVAAGTDHCLALRADGSIVGWGYDYHGQVSQAPTGTGFMAVAAGYYHSHALKADGSIVSWGSVGYDDWGCVSQTPTDTGFVAIDAGEMTCHALRADGSIVSWGNDYYGQVSETPAGTGFIAVSAGDTHSLALRADGSIVSWGNDDTSGCVSQTPTGTGFTAIAAGYYTSLALRIPTPPPTITGIAPNQASKGLSTVPFTITGTHFQDGAEVVISMRTTMPPPFEVVMIQASDEQVHDAGGQQTITGTFNLGGALVGLYNITVTNPDGTSGTYQDGFTITGPVLAVTSINPNTGGQGTTVSIDNLAGTGFQNGATVTLQAYGHPDIVGTNVAVRSYSQINCQFVLPLTAAEGWWNVVVTIPGGANATLLTGFHVVRPVLSVSSITPNTGGQRTTVSITDLTGTGFQNGATVKLYRAPVGSPADEIPATGVTVVSPTKITCQFVLPRYLWDGDLGKWDVVVTNPNGDSETFTDGFTVVRPVLSASSIAPDAGLQGETVAITNLAGTGFQNGATVMLQAIGHADIPGTNVATVSPAQMTCTFAIPATAAVGYWNVTVRNANGDTATMMNAFHITKPVLSVSSIAPNTGAQGATVAITNVAGGGFQNGATLKLTRTGSTDINATGVTVASASKITCQVAVPATAALGDWNVVVTNPNGDSTTLTNAFHVVAGAITVTSISPASGLPGTTYPTVYVLGTGFADGAEVALRAGPGGAVINATGETWINATAIRCSLDIPADAYPGLYRVSVKNPNGDWIGKADGFTVTTRAPSLIGISPASASRGSTITAYLSGSFTNGDEVTIYGGAVPIGVSAVTWVNATTLRCNITIPSTASLGAYTVLVGNSMGSDDLAGGFTVTDPLTVTAIAPNISARGTTVSTTITGTGFTAPATVKLSKILSLMPPRIESITATNVTVQSPTQIMCTFDVPTTASLGTWNVGVTNPDGQVGTLFSGFTVPAPPTVTAIAPNISTRSSTVPVTITGTDFAAPVTVTLMKIFSGFPPRFEMITATDVVVRSPTQITCTFAVPATAYIGAWSVVVRNPDAQAGSLSEAFTILDVPTVTGISPDSAALFDTLPEVSVTGTSFVPGAQVSLRNGTVVIDATDEAVIDATTIRCALAIPWNAPVGTYNVSVENPGAVRVEKADAFTVVAATPYVTAIQPNQEYPAATVSIHVDGTNFMTGTEIEMRGGPGDETVIETDEYWNYPDLTVVLTIPSTTPAGIYQVYARNPGGTWFTTGLTFTVLEPPTVTGISPDSAALFDTLPEVYVTGTNFASGAQVSLRRGETVTEATGETRINATTIRCGLSFDWMTPLGAYGVYVTNPGTAMVGRADAFTVVAATPYVTAIQPNQEYPAATVSIHVDGTNFMTGTEIEMRGGPGDETVIETDEYWNYPDLTVVLTIPSTTPAGIYQVYARNPGGTWFTTGVAFTVLEPLTVTGISPNTGLQGSTVAITNLSGAGFELGSTVKLTRIGSADISADSVSAVSATKITCEFALPATAETGSWNVVAINLDGGSAMLADGFTVTAPVTPTVIPTPTVTQFPGGSGPPTDPDSNRLYEDVNGNLRTDFADVVLYFNQMAWIPAHEPLAAFDYNGNGRIDFADVVGLFNHL
jgi:PKD repeat protein